MKPASQNFNEEEECHSSESGWTMYIGSPSNGTEDDKLNVADFEEEDDVGDHKNERNQEEDDDTDDSMASDASSGPSHMREHCVRNAKINDTRYVNPKEKGNGKGCSNTKNGIKNQDKGESVFSAKGAKVPSNGGKVRKSIWKGKGK
ncbi:PREDICTED: uncharacterized protein LOC109242360 [Nicotiana attenuata]|uniref:Uncharacterized protein n=1 Tax=Nicotiana attenuata TaxID=49451 RepID=A0A314L3R7_NICAT|nr:PREDICTED: uncharacterized protein LOC109242360 [Nicotiana attenuata]XP_019264767.1 PREDICTED: uncharacterized protein LOC109242360 [Nicotiana attenuata]XP_019264768.1 PREDICTED: uncharacterized protein LOC109242360 [Nicotiana attenuata]OIT36193.1 hypothetical protein A4A49_02896 [Nicotiana attenuata]